MGTPDFPGVSRILATPGGVTGTAVLTWPVPDPGPDTPGGDVWRLVAVTFRVVTSAVVATRTPQLSIAGGDNVPYAIAAAGYGITASSTCDYSYVLGLSEWDQANNAAASGPVPTVPLCADDAISLSLAAADVGDAISRVHVVLAPSSVL